MISALPSTITAPHDDWADYQAHRAEFEGLGFKFTPLYGGRFLLQRWVLERVVDLEQGRHMLANIQRRLQREASV